ncbi:unnamed protein product [marine sediment metagenome]|uniref:Uncharacterized protein n=1 Tax=marine sediment metagenome TaxID=412755 RepID=X1HRS9_9ZZZZ
MTIPSPNRPLRIYFLSPDLNDGWPEELKDNVRVSFDAKILENMASIHMWGTIIEIVKIEKLD